MIINVTIVPNAKFFEVEKIGEDSYHVRVDAPPRDNKANNRLIEILEIYFKTKKSRIRILKGTTSRKKVVEVL
jgi:hypothetical protein